MSDLSNLMRHEDGRGRHVHPHAGLVDSYRSDTHSIKVSHATEIDDNGQPRISGWIPILRGTAGANGKQAIGPSIGDQAVIGYLDGNPDAPFVMGFMHNDQDQPPKVESGEGHTTLAGGKYDHFVDMNGNLTETTTGKTAITGKDDAIFDYGGKTLTFKATTIILQSSDIRLGGSDASLPLAMKGTLDTAGNADVSNLSTTVKTK